MITLRVRTMKMKQNIAVNGGKPVAHHTFYGTSLPLALKVEDYGYPISTIGDTTTLALGDTTIVIRRNCADISHIKFFKDRKMLYDCVDCTHKNNLIRLIGGVIVVMKDNRVILNKVYPLR
jgi:hypothetical protein